MPDFLLQLDRHLFHFINHDLANSLFDWLMPWLRNARSWIPLYVCIVGFCLYRYKKTGLIIILGIALSAGFADFTSASIYKPMIKRVRPCRDKVVSKTDIVRAGCGTGYSFPSTHATDHFAMAYFMIFIFYKRWRWILLWATLWAGSISFAQVYVGVHFPIDVFCGALYGIFVGWLISLIFKKLQPQF
jgi:membrane-associated phospholipid phosphatase